MALDRRQLNEVVAERLRHDIVVGRLRAGERLAEERLADDYGVSRTPVREALRRLQAEGFVDMVPNRGATVRSVGLDEARDLLAVRAALETLVVRQAVERASPADVVDMRALVAAGVAATSRHDWDEVTELNARFHDRLALASGNAIAHQLITQLRDRIAWVYASEVARRAAASWSEHADIVDALGRRDAELAVRRIATHIANAERAYRPRHTPHEA
jgi:DNA-binding GntR family transcriptional regulator